MRRVQGAAVSSCAKASLDASSARALQQTTRDDQTRFPQIGRAFAIVGQQRNRISLCDLLVAFDRGVAPMSGRQERWHAAAQSILGFNTNEAVE